MSGLVDHQLVRDYLAGSPGARSRLAERLRCVGRILAALNRDASRPLQDNDLMDLTQDVQVLVLEKLPEFEGRSKLESWVFRICSLQLMGRIRQKRRRPLGLDDLAGAEPTQAPLLCAEESGLGHFLRHLAPREAEVVRLRHVEALTMNEVGDALGVSASSVKTHYYRAIDKLREVFGARSDAGGESEGGVA